MIDRFVLYKINNVICICVLCLRGFYFKSNIMTFFKWRPPPPITIKFDVFDWLEQDWVYTNELKSHTPPVEDLL